MGQPVRPLKNKFKAEYQRGYQHGARWPLHKPPFPPEPVIAELVSALRELRDAIDGQLSTFEPNDPMNAALSPYIERADKAQQAMALWLLDRT